MSPGADGRGQPLGDDLEQPVADVVAEGVVDLLEPVEVDEHEGDRAVVQRLLRPLARTGCGWAGR